MNRPPPVRAADASSSSVPLTEAVVRQLRTRLPHILAAGDSGQKVILHIAPGRTSVKIEWPPDVEEVRP